MPYNEKVGGGRKVFHFPFSLIIWTLSRDKEQILTIHEETKICFLRDQNGKKDLQIPIEKDLQCIHSKENHAIALTDLTGCHV